MIHNNDTVQSKCIWSEPKGKLECDWVVTVFTKDIPSLLWYLIISSSIPTIVVGFYPGKFIRHSDNNWNIFSNLTSSRSLMILFRLLRILFFFKKILFEVRLTCQKLWFPLVDLSCSPFCHSKLNRTHYIRKKKLAAH